MPGPPPKPTNQLHSWRNKSRPNEPRPTVLLLDPPVTLSAAALLLWGDIAQDLYDAGLSTSLDRDSMGRICEVRAEIALMRKTLDNEGWFSTNVTGGRMRHPAVGILHQAQDYLLRLEMQYGMTPSARTRVEAMPPKDGELVESKARFVKRKKKETN